MKLCILFPSLLAAALGAPDPGGWVPARWMSADPASLQLLAGTPINCLLLEPEHWAGDFAEQARSRQISTLGVVRPDGDPLQAAKRAAARKLDGVVLEGEFEAAVVQAVREVLSKAVVIEMLPRRGLRPDAAPVLATYQGVWPGIPVLPGGSAKAGPTGSPWVNTNMGFLLFVRSWTDSPVWIGNAPPNGQVLKVENYLQAICDAAIIGARWVLALDPHFSRRLLAREAAASADWKRIAAHVRYFEENKRWRTLRGYRGISVIQDAEAGALVSGGLLDMIASRHNPVSVVPRGRLSDDTLRGSRMVLNLEAALLDNRQKEIVNRYTSAGGLLLTSPSEIKLPALAGEEITISEKELKEIDFLWRDINNTIWHANLGVKLHHAAGMLSRLLSETEGPGTVVHLVNYTSYPVENVTVRFPGAKLRRARLMTPESAPQELEVYELERSPAIDIDLVPVCATVIVE